MCTLTILIREHDLIITMNRDEQRARRQEVPPSMWPNHGMTAPCDADAGGTWIAATPSGNWACLLNSYVPYKPPAEALSRGAIIPTLLTTPVPLAALHALDLVHYLPFRLVVGNRTQWHIHHWDGQTLTVEDQSSGADVMFSSSSWNADEVLTKRDDAFSRWKERGRMNDEQGIPTIHRWQESGDEKSSILMQRPESCTTSITQIILPLDASPPRMHYWLAAKVTPLVL